MRTKILFGTTIAGLLAFLYAVTLAPQPASAGAGKNLKVLPASMSKKEIKKVMKSISKAVGKSCDECHDLEDFSKDTKMKKEAREMFRLASSINARLKKDGFKAQVTCNTCHRGKAKPEKK